MCMEGKIMKVCEETEGKTHDGGTVMAMEEK